MRVPLVLLGGIVVLSVAVARALSCVCSPLECDLLTEEDCPGGLTWDPCKCCKVCARVEGEPCGGLFGFSGSCAIGLQCIIKNLLHHAREVDEGICTKIPGRWRRHCPQGPKMSEPGCNLVGEGITDATGNALAAGKCICGRSVTWCPGEPKPYTYRTRHECKLNLAAKIAYDDLFESPATSSSNGVHGSPCPEDSVASEDGGCKCVAPCPIDKCRPGQQPFPVRPADPETPGSCCPLYKCLPSEPVSWMGTEDDLELLSCTDHSGLPRSNGENWQEGPCENCICEEGKVSCQTPMCKSCENPIPAAPGECCDHCPTHHNATVKCEPLTDCKLRCENGNVNDDHDCPTCLCVNTKAPGIANTEDKICPELPHCGLNCELVEDEGGCPVCACQDTHSTTVIPTNSGEDQEKMESEEDKTICPELKCDLHCENGLLMDENDCTLCQCKPHPGCPPMSGCKKKCSFGYKVNKRGCSVCRCRASCIDHYNETHPEGSTWKPNSCTTCSCDASGRLSCKETICSVACSNPEPPKPGNCCPICPITIQKEIENAHSGSRSWGTVPITLIVVLALLCVILMVHIVRNKFRGRLSPTATSYSPYPSQYYKCVPIYDTSSMHQNEKMVHL